MARLPSGTARASLPATERRGKGAAPGWGIISTPFFTCAQLGLIMALVRHGADARAAAGGGVGDARQDPSVKDRKMSRVSGMPSPTLAPG